MSIYMPVEIEGHADEYGDLGYAARYAVPAFSVRGYVTNKDGTLKLWPTAEDAKAAALSRVQDEYGA